MPFAEHPDSIQRSTNLQSTAMKETNMIQILKAKMTKEMTK